MIIPIHHIHHDAAGGRTEEFEPARFPGAAAKDRPGRPIFRSGAGRRMCIGQSFALMEMVLMAVIMSQRFTFDLRPGHPVEIPKRR